MATNAEIFFEHDRWGHNVAWSVALQVDAEAAFPLRPGRLVVGVRYLWVDLGRTSQGDTINGNTAGLMGDLGYRLIW